MPNKDPNLWQSIYLAISASATWQGAIMATIIAILRILYDGNETKPLRIILEALICGALSLCVVSIVEFFNLPSSAAITMGGAIGFIGVQTLRDFILKGIIKRIEKNDRR